MEWYTKILRILGGYRFFFALLVQGFFLHPCYQSNKTAQLLRLGLIPIIIWLAVSSIHVRQFEPVEDFFHINFPIVSFPTFHSICLALEFGLFRGSLLEVPTSRPKNTEKEVSSELKEENLRKLNETPVTKLPPNSTFPSFAERFKFLVWLIFSPRGLRTAWSPPTSVVPVGTEMSMKKFVMSTSIKALLLQFLFTFFWAIGTSFAHNPSGVYGYLTQELGVPQNLILKKTAPFLICIPFASSAMLLIDMLGCMFNLIEVLVYHLGPKVLPSSLAPGRWDSTLYPPLFNEPWKADSLLKFWSQAWHAIFRQHILFCGSTPLSWLFRPFGKDVTRIAGLMGAMTFSGLFHEFVLATASKLDPNFSTTWVFAGSGIGMVAEIAFKKITGRQVGGLLGKVWFCGLLLILGRPGMENWVERGLGRSGVPPVAEWSKLRLFVPFGPWLPEKWLSSVSQWCTEMKI
ncbi:hypothetical protein CROQUDRAFT_662063 [Cronartium quercuum f. sp. fusiforme G11]|uniref:Wax synthase domain-containing protein n=1 Tax=Cronartium quercuum f. sp. fusiforme G11 TaxID=708437 RepID=A0A9P6T8A3_9BASI|nr:hypothetical protein CROQUDRAFT_662063 [Cronartium quercuum f. sp. fusiforme G11]